MANENEQKSFWKEKCIGRIPTTIPALYDTDIHDVVDGQVLTYNAAKEKWVNGTGSGGGGTVGNGTITIKQGLDNKGSFTVNQEGNTTINLDAGIADSFSGVKVGNTTVSAEGEETIEIEGDGTVSVSLDTNPSTNNKRLTITGSGGGGGAVDSVNGKTGTVELTASDVDALPSDTQYVSPSDLNSYQTKLSSQIAYRDVGTSSLVPVITTNSLGQVTAIGTTPINVGQNQKADKVSDAIENNFAALDNTGNLIDSGISKNIIQSLQSQINDIYAQLVGVSATAVARSYVVAGHAAPIIDINISATDTMSDITVFRILNPGTASETRIQIYTSGTSGTSWSCTDGDSLHTFTAPSTIGNTIAYQVIATRDTVEKSITVYVEVVEDRVTGLTWTGGSISPATVEAGGTATLTKGTVTATYLSGETSDVTNSATFSATGGTIAGTTYTAPGTPGTYAIKASYGGVTSSQTLSVAVTSTRADVQFGVGTTYANAVWTTVGPLTNNLAVNGISNAQGDYLFIKYDSRDTVNNLWINSDIPSQIDLDAAITDGDYKYRRSDSRRASPTPVDYIINKV